MMMSLKTDNIMMTTTLGIYAWKTANIQPVCNLDHRTVPVTYNPIVTTSILCKVHILSDRLQAYLEFRVLETLVSVSSASGLQNVHVKAIEKYSRYEKGCHLSFLRMLPELIITTGYCVWIDFLVCMCYM